MKKNYLLLLFLSGMMILTLFCSVFPQNSTIITNIEEKPSIDPDVEKNPNSSEYWTVSPIQVTGSTWSTFVGNPWFSGAGIWGNPYIIQNLTIDGTGSAYGIFIQNSQNYYFIIKNCKITNAGLAFDDGGIKLVNTKNGKIINNTCSYNEYAGIALSSSSNNNTIAGNIANYNDQGTQGCGILLDKFSNNNTVYNNHAHYNRRDGILIYYGSSGNNITYNNASKNYRSDIMILSGGSNCRYNTLAYNNLTYYTGNEGGIHLESVDNNFILYNNISNGQSTAAALSLLQANGNTIIGNIINNSRGITIAGTASGWTSSNNYISDNIITYNSGDGLTLTASAVDHCNNNTVVNNVIHHNTGYGIRLQRASSNKIYYNKAKDNGNYGIYLYTASNYNEIIYYDIEVDSLYISGDSIGNIVQELTYPGPILTDLYESEDPIEFGDILTIQINATDPDEVNTTLLEILGANYTMTHVGGETWEYNWTSTSLGFISYTIWSNDSNNNWGSYSDSITVRDTTAPSVFALYESDNFLEAGNILTVQINATDLVGVDSVLFDILGVNHTMTNIEGNKWEYKWTSSSISIIPYTIWAKDTSNNLNSTSDSVMIQDTVAPSIDFIFLSDDPVELGDNLTIQALITDAGGVDTVFFEVLSVNYTMICTGIDSWAFNWTTKSLGTIPYEVHANDTGGNWDLYSSDVDVQDTTGPVLFDLIEISDPNILGENTTFQINVTDFSGVNAVLFEIESANITMTNIGGNKWEYNWTSSDIGEHFYKIWTNDSYNNWNSLASSIIVQDTVPPTLSDFFNSTNLIEVGNILTVRINSTDIVEVDTVLFEIQGENYTMTNILGNRWEYNWISSSLGSIPYTIWTNDTGNNWNSYSDSVVVQDTIVPWINFVILISNPVEFGNKLTVQATVIDAGTIDTVLFEILGDNYTMIYKGANIWEYNWTPSSLGIAIPYKIHVNDTGTNKNSYSDTITVQDATSPALINLSLASSVELGNKFKITVNSTDLSGVDAVLLEILGANYTMTNIGGDKWEINWTSSSIGNIPYKIWANDTENNLNSLSDSVSVQDTTKPLLFNIYESVNLIEAGNVLTVRLDATDLGGIVTMLFEILNANHTMVKVGQNTWEYQWISHSPGIKFYTIWAIDSSNNWITYGDSVTVQDTVGPELLSQVRIGKAEVGKLNVIQASIVDVNNVSTVLIAIFGSNYTMTRTTSTDTWTYQFTTSSAKVIYYSIWANDSYNNGRKLFSGSVTIKEKENGETTVESPPNVTIIIIILIIIGCAIGVSGYVIVTKRHKKPAGRPITVPSELEAAKKRELLLKTSPIELAKPENKLKKKKAEIQPKPLTQEEIAELQKTEKEVDVKKQGFTCLVHRGPIYGNKIYLCKHCNTFYCERCAKVLKIKGDKCWTCENEIDIEITESDRRELLEKNTLENIEAFINERAFLKEFLESNKTFEDFPQFKEQVLTAISPEEINALDQLKLPTDDKKRFILEFLNLDREERKKFLELLKTKEDSITKNDILVQSSPTEPLKNKTAPALKKDAGDKKLMTSLEEVAADLLPSEEIAELTKIEKELAIEKQEFTCVVHRGKISGNKYYTCRKCNTVYCEQCAKVLRIKGEKCWTCENDIDIRISKSDQQELAKKKAIESVERFINERKQLLKK